VRCTYIVVNLKLHVSKLCVCVSVCLSVYHFNISFYSLPICLYVRCSVCSCAICYNFVVLIFFVVWTRTDLPSHISRKHDLLPYIEAKSKCSLAQLIGSLWYQWKPLCISESSMHIGLFEEAMSSVQFNFTCTPVRLGCILGFQAGRVKIHDILHGPIVCKICLWLISI
jgi:hypothetical protein